MSETNETPMAQDLWDRILVLFSMPKAQAELRTDMEFSVAETEHILERLHQLSSEISKSSYDAEICRVSAEALAAMIAVIEKTTALSENGKYVIPMNFWEMDGFLDAFRIERETFKGWTKTELRQRRRYVEVVTDIDERFKPVYNQRCVPYVWHPDGKSARGAGSVMNSNTEEQDDPLVRDGMAIGDYD